MKESYIQDVSCEKILFPIKRKKDKAKSTNLVIAHHRTHLFTEYIKSIHCTFLDYSFG